MEREFRSDGSDTLRDLKADEVVEVLEGPRKVKFDAALRVRGKLCKDGASGWLTHTDKDGTVNAELGDKYYCCTSAIAMTDDRDIKACKVLRKLDVKEVILVLEGPHEEQNGVVRVKGKAVKDDVTGWITVKGNAGTVYATASTKHYTMLRPTPLQKKFRDKTPATVRSVEKDEVFELLEGPVEETFEDVIRVKGRATSDGVIGWFTVAGNNVKPWAPFYKCTSGTVINDALTVKGAQVVRRIEAGEVLELLEGPVEEKDLGVMRIRGRAEKDGTEGWVTIKGNQGTAFLEVKGK